MVVQRKKRGSAQVPAQATSHEDSSSRVGGSIKATRPTICYHNRHLRSPDTDMDDLRESFSKLKRDVKHRLTGSKRKADKKPDRRGETVADPSGSLPRPEPPAVTGGGRERKGDRSNAGESVESSAAADETKSDWKSTASSSAKLLLRGVRDSADAFPPLKSVAGGLCFILENCDVRPPITYSVRGAYRCHSVQRLINKQ